MYDIIPYLIISDHRLQYIIQW